MWFALTVSNWNEKLERHVASIYENAPLAHALNRKMARLRNGLVPDVVVVLIQNALSYKIPYWNQGSLCYPVFPKCEFCISSRDNNNLQIGIRTALPGVVVRSLSVGHLGPALLAAVGEEKRRNHTPAAMWFFCNASWIQVLE